MVNPTPGGYVASPLASHHPLPRPASSRPSARQPFRGRGGASAPPAVAPCTPPRPLVCLRVGAFPPRLTRRITTRVAKPLAPIPRLAPRRVSLFGDGAGLQLRPQRPKILNLTICQNVKMSQSHFEPASPHGKKVRRRGDVGPGEGELWLMLLSVCFSSYQTGNSPKNIF